MASKRTSPHDEPSTASSSDEEEEVSSEGEEDEESEGEDEEEEEEEEPAQPAKPSSTVPPPAMEKKSTPKKPPTSATTQSQASSSESASHSRHPTASSTKKGEEVSSEEEEEEPAHTAKHSSSVPPQAIQKKSIPKMPPTSATTQPQLSSSESASDFGHPTASSSEEGEEVSSGDKEEEEEPGQPAKPSSIVPPPAIEKKSTLEKPPTSATPQPQPSSSESASNSGSKTEDDQPTVAVDVKAKPNASKPMEEDLKNNSKAQPTARPSRSGTKRPNDNSSPESGVKRAKGTDAASSNELVPEEDSKKKPDSKRLFQRLWSEEDEIVILNGMNDYRLKNGDPYKNMNAFHGFIKDSLHVDVVRSQLTDKIWRLKKKYKKNATKGKNGEDPGFTKDHDQKIYELSKKVWGSEGSTRGVEQEKSNINVVNIKKGSTSRNVASPLALVTYSPNSMGVEKVNTGQSSGLISSVNQMIKFSGLSEDVIRRGFELLETPKRIELEERWWNLQLLEVEIFAKRAELFNDQSKLILEAYRSSNH